MLTPEQMNDHMKEKILDLKKEEVDKFEFGENYRLNVFLTNNIHMRVYFSSIKERTDFTNQLLLKWE